MQKLHHASQKSYNQPDRFIFTRNHFVNVIKPETKDTSMVPENVPENYQQYITKQLFTPDLDEQLMFVYSQQENCNLQSNTTKNNWIVNDVRNLLSKRKLSYSSQQTYKMRYIAPTPEKILDAPELKDDYYLNLLDWSSKGILSIGLADKVYLYSPQNISELCQKEEDYICSLSFHPQGNLLSVGLSNGKVQIYDINREIVVRTLKGHSNRVSSSAFTYGTLFTGSRDSLIIGHDYRVQNNVVSKFQGHRGQVCGLKHDPCGLASGSNDNTAIVWDINMVKQKYLLQGHKAAVKAIAWCPWQRNLLATGGGSSDKTMRFWNIQTGKNLNTVNTESQVCSLIWNKHQKQILSSHGFSENQLSLWKYPQCTKIAELHGHQQRVLHMCLSPDDSTVCTASADQTLRFWKVFQNSAGRKSDEKQEWKMDSKYSCTLR